MKTLINITQYLKPWPDLKPPPIFCIDVSRSSWAEQAFIYSENMTKYKEALKKIPVKL